MNSIKYVGLDVHRDTISVAVLNAEGKRVMQCVLATQAKAIVEFFAGLRGTLHVSSKKARMRRGCTICWCSAWPDWWYAIRARMRC